jgi:hypothetical protein
MSRCSERHSPSSLMSRPQTQIATRRKPSWKTFSYLWRAFFVFLQQPFNFSLGARMRRRLFVLLTPVSGVQVPGSLLLAHSPKVVCARSLAAHRRAEREREKASRLLCRRRALANIAVVCPSRRRRRTPHHVSHTLARWPRSSRRAGVIFV